MTGVRYLSTGEAARMLGVDASTLRRYAAAGQVRTTTTLGGHYRYLERDLRELVARRIRGQR